MDVILRRKPVRIDTASMNGRRFLNVSTGGVGAEATAETPADVKASLGPLAYAITAVRKLAGRPGATRAFTSAGFGLDADFLAFAVGQRARDRRRHDDDARCERDRRPARPLRDRERCRAATSRGWRMQREARRARRTAGRALRAAPVAQGDGHRAAQREPRWRERWRRRCATIGRGGPICCVHVQHLPGRSPRGRDREGTREGQQNARRPVRMPGVRRFGRSTDLTCRAASSSRR